MIRKSTYLGQLFISPRWYWSMAIVFCTALLGFFAAPMLWLAQAALFMLCLLSITDLALLFSRRHPLDGERLVPQRLSLGDNNRIDIIISNHFRFDVSIDLIDEIPVQFQERDFRLQIPIAYGKTTKTHYDLYPRERGLYSFGRLLAYVRTPLQFFQRKIVVVHDGETKVYPSFAQLNKYDLLARSESFTPGNRKTRKLGHSLEFEKTKEYVAGDDIRTLNWKATARRNTLMVNTYSDSKQQQIYCILDKGRVMKTPFDGLSLLDHSINATLALLRIVLLKQDKAGLICFTKNETEMIAADRRNKQFFHIREALYKQQTDFQESDYNSLRSLIQRKIGQRSLLILFTNFDTLSAMERQLPYLRMIARQHLLCVVIFENTLLKKQQEEEAGTLKDVYLQTIGAQFSFEKKQIIRELRRHGILAILSTPQSLSIDVINKYLELKSRHMV